MDILTEQYMYLSACHYLPANIVQIRLGLYTTYRPIEFSSYILGASSDINNYMFFKNLVAM